MTSGEADSNPLLGNSTNGPTEHVAVLSRRLLEIIIDLGFVSLVAALNFFVNKFVFEKVHATGSSAVALFVLDWGFTIATLSLVMGFLIHDVVVGFARLYRSARAELTSPVDVRGRSA